MTLTRLTQHLSDHTNPLELREKMLVLFLIHIFKHLQKRRPLKVHIEVLQPFLPKFTARFTGPLKGTWYKERISIQSSHNGH
jgi:hypothetical protein